MRCNFSRWLLPIRSPSLYIVSGWDRAIILFNSVLELIIRRLIINTGTYGGATARSFPLGETRMLTFEALDSLWTVISPSSLSVNSVKMAYLMSIGPRRRGGAISTGRSGVADGWRDSVSRFSTIFT